MIWRYFVISIIGFLLTNCASVPPGLNEKLEKQWQHYALARTNLLRSVETEKSGDFKALSRDDWEKSIALEGREAFNESDLKSLQLRQNLQIELAHKQNVKNSIIDFEEIRKQKLTSQFCAKIPKGGMLHIHPSGTINAKTLRRMLRKQNPLISITKLINEITAANSGAQLSNEEITLLKKLPSEKRFKQLSKKERAIFERFFFLPKGKQSFLRFNAVFHFISLIATDLPSFEEFLGDFAKRAYQEQVSYVELTGKYNPDIPPILSRIEKATGLVIRVNRSFNRSETLSEISNKWQKASSFPANHFLVGIDFLDNEEANPAFEKGQQLYGITLLHSIDGRSKLRRTMHAGEIGDLKNPRDAMIMGAERLGHGVLLSEDPVALEFAAKTHQPIEVNLSSNLRLTKVSKMSEHPFLNFIRLGLAVSLSTDDEGIFETDINQECELAIQQSDINYFELKTMIFNSIETSFASTNDKLKIRDNLKLAFDVFEADLQWPQTGKTN